jgi:NADH-quinone oxidoreductase subunit M
VIALAVPGSSAFAGEFLVLAGVFQQYWLYAVVGAVAIVLAAMYVLRLISGVLHQDVGSAVSDAARDLVPAELAILVPLVAALLALSVWPAAISDHAFPADRATPSVTQNFNEVQAADSGLPIVVINVSKPTTLTTP